MSEVRPTLLIDGHSLLWRAYHVGGALHDAHGPTGAAYIFLKMLRPALDLTNAQGCWVAWDAGRSWRHAEYPGYKAQRGRSSDGSVRSTVDQQREWLTQLLPLLGVGVTWAAGWEADDVVAALALHVLPRDQHKIILSSDRDFWQLVSERVDCLAPVKGGMRRVTLRTFEADTGVRSPAEWFAVRVVAGDASDNLLGVRGLGEKRARKLVVEVADRGELGVATLCAALDPCHAETIHRNARLMNLRTAAKQLYQEDSVAVRTCAPAQDLVLARTWVKLRAMHALVGSWAQWSRPFERLAP